MGFIHKSLIKAKALFNRGENWCTGNMCQVIDGDGVELESPKYCAVGAIRKVVNGKAGLVTNKECNVIDMLINANPDHLTYYKWLGNGIKAKENVVIKLNDSADYPDVAKMFTKAIRKARDLGV